MRYLFLALLCSAAPNAFAQSDTVVGDTSSLRGHSLRNLDISLVVRMPTKNMVGIQGGYVSAFGRKEWISTGGSFETLPGWSAGLVYRRTLGRRFTLHSGAVYTAKYVELSLNGRSFRQESHVASIPLAVGYPVLFYVRNRLADLHLKLGFQADLYRFRSPVSGTYEGLEHSVDPLADIGWTASAELMYYLPTVRGRRHALTAAYYFGLNEWGGGTVRDPLDESALYYRFAGTYLEVRYTFFLTHPYR